MHLKADPLFFQPLRKGVNQAEIKNANVLAAIGVRLHQLCETRIKFANAEINPQGGSLDVTQRSNDLCIAQGLTILSCKAMLGSHVSFNL